MSKDYYKILGIDKNASKDDVKKAYRKLAHQYHPDKKTGDEKRFKEVNEAYTILSNDQKRAQYDQFGADFSGAGAGFGGFGQGFNSAGGFSGFDFSSFTRGQNVDIDLNDILSSFFGGGGRRVVKGKNIVIDVEIEFKESILGVSKEIKINRQRGGQETLRIDIPIGIDSGEMLKFSKKGEHVENGVPGDLYVRVHVKKHPDLQKEGNHLILNLNITISESLLGTKKDIDIITKKMSVKIPAGIKNSELLRVRGAGVKISDNYVGDLLIKVNIIIPKKFTRKAKKAIEILKEEGF